MSSAICFKLDLSKILSYGNGLRCDVELGVESEDQRSEFHILLSDLDLQC